jgi:hypothetical protein
VNRVCPNELLPESGLLAYFYDTISYPSGHQPSEAGRWAIRLSRQVTHIAPPPKDPPANRAFRQVSLSAVGELTIPGLRTSAIERIGLTDAEEDAYVAVREQLAKERGSETIHRVLGWPDEIQHDPASYVQVPANGFDGLDPNVVKRDDVQRLLAERSVWQLMLQVDTDDAAGMLWGDGGRLYFMMREVDSRGGNWGKAWLNLQDD